MFSIQRVYVNDIIFLNFTHLNKHTVHCIRPSLTDRHCHWPLRLEKAILQCSGGRTLKESN